MWLIFGITAIVLTFMNLYLYKVGKDYQRTMALALSFTALTLCDFYSLASHWVIVEDWSALQDVVPYVDPALWVLTMISIGLNNIPNLLTLRKKV